MRMSIFSRFAVALVTPVLGTVTVGMVTPAAQAVPLYNGSVQVELALAEVSPAGSSPSVQGQTFTDTLTNTVAENGSGVAEASAIADVVAEDEPEGVRALAEKALATDRAAHLFAEVHGKADPPPFSSSEADAEARGDLFFENPSASESLTMTFLLDFVFDLAASAADSTEEAAVAGLGVEVVDLLAGEIFSVTCTVTAPSLPGSGSCPSAGTLAFDVALLPSEASWLTVRAVAFGSAVVGRAAVVAEPGTIGLIVAGLAGLGFMGARRIRLR